MNSNQTMSTHISPDNNNGNRVKMVAGYALQQRLGSGSFATVYKGVKVEALQAPTDEDTVAIKAITRSSDKLTKKVMENLEMEISILRTYRHPNIVCLHDVQKTERHFYLILEYCGGGDVQRLIRTRKTGRLTERLTRRLVRDLASGLQFLWGQELIHRDIKPQNLLLTGPLPMDELHDPAKMDAHEDARRQANFPSSRFALKIADFGFARHLQTASLAETLCGSPLYMAPEILQHHRYDAKADLWSVGTVLFEMISGRPPFHGENHIDLLRNIQRKAVRLPPDVRVSKECVTMLRLLLNRNPLSRAGFKEFFEAAAAFVALGCEGEGNVSVGQKLQEPQGSYPQSKMDLGTIHEVDPSTPIQGAASSMMTVQTTANVPPPTTTDTNFVTPPLGPTPAPIGAPTSSLPLDSKQGQHAIQEHANGPLMMLKPSPYHGFAPLEPSPPSDGLTGAANLISTKTPPFPSLESRISGRPQLPQGLYSKEDSPQQSNAGTPPGGRSQTSSDDSEFVMVEHSKSASQSPAASVVRTTPTSSRYYVNSQSRGDSYLVVNDNKGCHVPKGMLSTSPGTGGALVDMLGAPARLMNDSVSSSPVRIDSQTANISKTLTTAEDVGRRAVSVAHLGDTRAYIAMRMVMMNEDGSSILSSTPMEGVEEASDEHSSAAVTDCEEDGSCSTETEVAAPSRRGSLASDRTMTEAKQEEEDDEEMPFAITPRAPLKASEIPVRVSVSSLPRGDRSRASSTKSVVKPSPQVIQSHFGEALSCYLKALSMLKGSVSAAQRVRLGLDTIKSVDLTSEQRNRLEDISRRCEITSTWLSGQFNGVLERADAANVEVGKIASSQLGTDRNEAVSPPPTPTVSVEELIYNHALACGRDGAVKQLLGQNEAARSCYRSAGLLAEALLMEPKLESDDRKVLEGYVDGFAARITELDEVMLQQSRTSSSGPGSSLGWSRRGSGVIGLIGGIAPPPAGYGVPGSTRKLV